MTPDLLQDLVPPFYLVDLPRLAAKRAAFEESFRAHFPHFVLAVSYKTNTLPALLAALHARGAWAEVVSDLELALAERLNVPADRIIYNGPGKSAAVVGSALERGHLINLDSLTEVDLACQWAHTRAATQPTVGLRINLALPDHATPGCRSRFGLSTKDGQVAEAATQLRAAGVRITCLHAHLNSRRRELGYFRTVAAELVAAVAVIGEDDLTTLDIGGGFGHAPPALAPLTFPTFAEYAEAIHGELSSGIAKLASLRVIAEPGIALVGDVVTYYAPVLATKQVAGRNICLVDGSVQTVKPTKHSVNLPTTALDGDYCPKDGPTRSWHVSGYTCLEDDWIAEDLALPDIVSGDILAMQNVGAYTSVFKPPFIRGMPAFYVFDGERCQLARRAEDFDDIFSRDILP